MAGFKAKRPTPSGRIYEDDLNKNKLYQQNPTNTKSFSIPLKSTVLEFECSLSIHSKKPEAAPKQNSLANFGPGRFKEMKR